MDVETKVEFYLLGTFDDKPEPYFSYSDVKPGNYICIQKPQVTTFLDDTVGIKSVNPQQVHISEIKYAQKLWSENCGNVILSLRYVCYKHVSY